MEEAASFNVTGLAIALGVIAFCQLGILGTAVLMFLRLAPTVHNLEDQVSNTLGTLRTAILQLDALLSNLNKSGLIQQAQGTMGKLEDALGHTAGVITKAQGTLETAQGAMGRIDPLATELQSTLSEARNLLDDATQTSQSVRERVDDLATTQRELTALTASLTDLLGEVRDEEVVKQLHNVLSDTSLLAADIGILTENANSYLEHGKPLVGNVSRVMSSAKKRASGISSKLGVLREGAKQESEMPESVEP